MSQTKAKQQPKRDDILDVIKTEAQREGYLKSTQFDHKDYQTKRSVKQLAEKAGISDSTLRNWFNRKTRRPQGITMRFALEALGVHTRLQRADGTFIRGW